MALAYKTPGVYVEEIPKFPPSIAAVETAIPAFIGYTEKASKNGVSLQDIPTRIESIAEFEEIFGGGPPQKLEIYLDSNNVYIGAAREKGFMLYDSLRLFYSNGGGNCYIVSVGDFNTTITKASLVGGINKLESEDEPTILLFPDAANLSNTELCDVQVEALKQCNKLQDRVTVCDLKHSGAFKTDVNDFRNNVGINNLKYGAAYGPWLNASLSRFIYLRDLTFKRNTSGGSTVALESMTSDKATLQILFDVSKAQSAVDTLKSSEKTETGGKKWEDKQKELFDAYDTSPGTDALRNTCNTLAKIVAKVQEMTVSLPAITTASTIPTGETKDLLLKTDIEAYIKNSKLKAVFDNLAAQDKYFSTLTPPPPAVHIFADISGSPPSVIATTDLSKAILLLGYNSNPSAAATPATAATAFLGVSAAVNTPSTDALKNARNDAMQAFSEVIALYRYAQKSAAEYEKKFNEGLLNSFGAYKNLTIKAAECLNLLPPSGAIAGVYAAVDRDRGVWKAPANVSLNSIISPAVKISHEQQGEFNVDVNAGKSINIIRAFTGKGTLVWGARTLAGNDNEWRYVNVRRFFNMVEESTKKATEQFVFEPNDANTWVKMQAMIENFLTTLWRQGALQGAKPEHAFYVAIGLGKTMTALDILEGRLIVEIGMAVVRPAEFIILRFSHKMPES